jgi:hypothetical protein
MGIGSTGMSVAFECFLATDPFKLAFFFTGKTFLPSLKLLVSQVAK